ncbi:hypothetical protein AYI68_g1563 [Smittium mucronatum]|uniref:Uncharacterized protein n=1 Tax=Smittium mucronatum TaxID=133383 RepID=A0A1R0H526_9FUNG|nr:hypothetical protein AYI68_g1563 [Smittium mucronatum]
MRMGNFRTVKRKSNIKFLDGNFKKNCFFSKIVVPETVDHILLNCPQWDKQRNETIRRFIPAAIRSE